MRFLRRFFIRLSNFTAGRRADQRLQDKLAEHLAFQTDENLRAGVSPAEARRQATLKLGAAEAIREDHTLSRGLLFLETLTQDLRYAVRMLVRSFHLRQRHRRAHCRRHRRQLLPCAARHARRSSHYAPIRLTVGTGRVKSKFRKRV